ncbi:protein SABRE isoform X1 [Typha angustifolia]|uniref:protein SABRE isoform X1 n=2 Tax=Typha angustifolia TaxID=59011 RepID=UPI003C2D921B
MASSPVKFFSAFLIVSVVGWVVFTFAARLLAWFLSRIMKASVGFRVAGCNCLRDVTVKFRKGGIESVSIGEIKLSLRKSLVKLGFSVISKDPKLQLLISDFEVVVRPSEQNKKTGKLQKSRSTGKGKWLVITSMARFLSISVTDLVVKVPKAIFDIKDLKVDISKVAGSTQTLRVKLHLVPLAVQFGDPRCSFDQTVSYNQRDCLQSDQAFPVILEKNLVPFVCEELSVNCDFGHEKERGVKITNLDLACGDITVSLNEGLFCKNYSTLETYNDVDNGGATLDITAAKKSLKNKSSLSSIKKQFFAFPDKVSFSVPKLDVKFMHLGEGLTIENNVTGIQLTSTRSQSHDNPEEATPHFDVQMDLSEIHLLREGATSVLEILKVAVVASLEVPLEPLLPIRAAVDAKLGGTQCKFVVSRLIPWMRLHLSKRKKMTLSKENPYAQRSQAGDMKPIMWNCTVSAPEMSIVLYNLNGVALYHGCSQSSHLFADNIATKEIQVHTELGELHLHMDDEYQESLTENVFDVETYSGSLMHIARVSLDWGYREIDFQEKPEQGRWAFVFSVDICGMGIQFGFKHVESLVLNLMSFRTLCKGLFSSGKRTAEKKVGHLNKKSPKGTQILKLNLEKCSIIYSGDMNIEDTVVADPKRVNFGSQGGEVIISVSADGTPRKASIASTLPGRCKNLKFSISLLISHLAMCVNKEKESAQIDIDRAKSIYQEDLEELEPSVKVTLFDLQNAKIVRRSGGLADVAVCSLFSATDITLRWEPDVHLVLYDIFNRLKYLLLNSKLQSSDNKLNLKSVDLKDKELEKDVLLNQVRPEKQHKKRESIFVVDVEILRISAELADGVEAMIHVQSIFSENAKIGVLMEGVMLSLNEARVFKSSRMQISCIPISTSNMLDPKVECSTKRDWVIQGLDVHICMPFRLPLRAIEDAVEDMIRGLKLVTAAKTSLSYPGKMGNKKARTRSTKFGSVRFVIRKLTADIEEEPIQGWLDEHYHLMKKEVCELGVRLRFLEEIISSSNKVSGSAEPNDIFLEKKILYNGVEVDLHDTIAIQGIREEIHKQSFRSYYQACKKLVFAEGSGACSRGCQAAFRPSTTRASLLSLSATELDVSLTKIEGGDSEMVEFIKKLDPVCLDKNIPFSRLYGRDIVVHAGSLVIQLRNYTYPLFSGTAGKCQGRIVLAQQATCFQPQIHQDVFIGRWHKVRMLRSASGTTPPMKMYSNLPVYFHKGEVSFGVGYEPAFADISYAFTVALRRANLSKRSCSSSLKDQAVMHIPFSANLISENQAPKKERSLPWWDDMRYYIHGKIVLYFNETTWNLLATSNPYENLDKLQIVSGYMDIQQTDGRVDISAKEFKIYISSLASLMKNCSLKVPSGVTSPFLYSPAFSLEVVMDWECESGNPLNHYLHALPIEGEPRKKVYDPFRSTSLSLRWNFSLRPSLLLCDNNTMPYFGDSILLDGAIYESSVKLQNTDSPTMNIGAHDLAWIFKWWSLNYSPPHKLRSFSRWPRFGIPKAVRSGNLSLDKVMTEFFLRLDATPSCIKYMPLGDDDPASGLTFKMCKLKYELCYSRGKQKYTFDCKRESLDLVYRGLDLHVLKVYLKRESNSSTVQDIQTTKKSSQTMLMDNEKCSYMSSSTDKQPDVGFLLSSDYFTIRRQAPKADPARLLAWQEAGRKNREMTYVRSEFENGSESDHTRSDPSDDDGFNVVIADNCQRVFVYGLKLLWTIENRDAVWSWVGGISKAFEPPKPSPSRQYAQRKIIEEKQKFDASKMHQDDNSPTLHGVSSPIAQVETLGPVSCPSPSNRVNCSSSDIAVKHGHIDDPSEGTRHFMVNVIQPQFNLHSEEANQGRFLLAAASGRILARSFHSVLHVGYEMIEQALGSSNLQIPESEPEMTWKRAELSVMLEHVQAHVAPTDVDPGAGLQWLPKILRSSEKVKRTGALLERVFMPCQMYFRYTRHKGGTADLKVKPLKELSFNSPNITATMTSRQFQVMLDVLSNLLFARLPKPRKSSLSYPSEDDDDIEEEADEVVPDGVEEVELAKISLEQRERERKLQLDDIRTLSETGDIQADVCLSPERNDDLWMVISGKLVLVQGLKKELLNIQKLRKTASSELRMALQKAAQLRLMEKEKNKSPSCAMRISMRINKVVWSMLADGKTFAEAEINDMIYDFDRDYKDIGVARFTTKSFVVRNCLLNAKSDMLLSAWNAPPEWGKNVMLRVDAKQGAPKDGNSPLELFQVDIYPLRIYLTETMYRMMWEYFFPEEEQDSQRRQEVWRVSTSAGSRRVRKSFTGPEAAASSSHSTRESDAPGRLSAATVTLPNGGSHQASTHGDTSQTSKLQSLKANMVCGSTPELRRTSSFDRTWEENVAESVANELVLQVNSSNISSKSGPLNLTPEHQHSVNEISRNKPKDSKPVRSGRLSHEEKKVGKSQDEKRARTRKMMEFHNIKISQVELLVTYEGSRFAVNDLRLLMDTFHRVDFTGTWRRLFSRVKKHIIWGVLKSVTGMQGKKFKDKAQNQREAHGTAVPEGDLNFSDSDGGQPGKSDNFPVSWLKRPSDGAGEGFVTSIRGLFNSQRRKAKAFVLRTMRGDADNEFHGEWSESDAEFSPIARQLTITKARKLIRRHTKKFRSRGQKSSGLTFQRESLPSTPRETTPFQSDSSGPSSYEDFHD